MILDNLRVTWVDRIGRYCLPPIIRPPFVHRDFTIIGLVTIGPSVCGIVTDALVVHDNYLLPATRYSCVRPDHLGPAVLLAMGSIIGADRICRDEARPVALE